MPWLVKGTGRVGKEGSWRDENTRERKNVMNEEIQNNVGRNLGEEGNFWVREEGKRRARQRQRGIKRMKI